MMHILTWIQEEYHTQKESSLSSAFFKFGPAGYINSLIYVIKILSLFAYKADLLFT